MRPEDVAALLGAMREMSVAAREVQTATAGYFAVADELLKVLETVMGDGGAPRRAALRRGGLHVVR